MFALLLSACSSDPVKKTPLVSGTLAGDKTANVRFQEEPAKTAVQFNTNGYTIFGAIYVAAAVAHMKDDTSTMQTAYENYLKGHPTALPLRETFNAELGKDLLNQGYAIRKVTAAKKVSNDHKLLYTINPSEVNANQAIVADGLLVQFFAKSSTDAYHPQAGVLISVMDGKGASTSPIKQEEFSVVGTESFEGFDDIKKDPDHAYLVLQKTVKQLAKKVADELTGAAPANATIISQK